LQSAVYRIAQAAEGAKDVEELFKAVHSIIDEVMPAKNFYIALYDDENDIVSFPYFVDEEDPPPEARRSRRGLTEYVIRTGRSLLSSLDAHQDLHRRGEIESIGAMSPIWLGVPLSIGGKTIGVMTVQHYSDPHAYGEREQQMLEFVSTQVAKAIEKKRTEELLRSNEKRYRTLIENSSDVVALIDKTGRVIYESPAIKRVLGFTSEERMGKNSFELIHPDDMIRAQEALRTLLQHHGAILPIEIRVRHSNGSWRWLEAVASNLLSDPNIQAIVVNYRDITERKQSVEALQDSEERFRSLFESATDAIFTLSLEGIVTSLNPAFEKITGWRCEEWIGRSMSSLIHEEDIAIANRAFSETLKGNIHPAYELRIRNKAGNYIVGEFTTTPQIDKGNIVGVLGIARDITERKKLEDQIRYIQKMESIGILAGGVAHDFNNILAIINAYAGSLKLMAELPPQFSHNIKIIEQTVKRGARIVQQLLMLAKKSETVFSETTICPIIEEVSKLAHETFPKTITFDIDLKDCNVQIPADGNQLYQVFLNLCLNARDAMPSGGTLLIKSFLVNGSLVRKEFPEASKEEYLAVSISDTGIGIDEETKDHIFEPFFTTKEFGKGTGLGLSVVYGIIQAHKGFIGVDSELNKGTTFIIYLPLHEQTEEKYLTEETFQVELRGGEETILLVEDEENLLDLLVEILQSYGYRILKARDGEEAVSVFRENQTQIKLVMSDLGLPKLGGYEAFLQMKKLNPNVKVILASGYKDTKVYDDMIKAGAEEFVQKPYNISEVIKKIRDALDSVQ
ncbi:MAG: PAS domain S-box protein, partial [Bacteroidetes bacterium]